LSEGKKEKILMKVKKNPVRFILLTFFDLIGLFDLIGVFVISSQN